MADQHDLAELLLGLAADDQAAVRAMLDVPSVTDSIVGFHAQQAVEKALKAVLASRGVEFPFTHSLAALMDLCDSAGASVTSSLFDARRLTPHAARLRYGLDATTDVTRAEAAEWAVEAIEWARALVEQSRPSG